MDFDDKVDTDCWFSFWNTRITVEPLYSTIGGVHEMRSCYRRIVVTGSRIFGQEPATITGCRMDHSPRYRKESGAVNGSSYVGMEP